MLGACAKVFRGRAGRDKIRNRRVHCVPAAGANGEDLPYRSKASKKDEKRTGKRKSAARKTARGAGFGVRKNGDGQARMENEERRAGAEVPDRQ